MLPEKLSNELCSLKHNVPRLVMVADMKINFQGELVQSQFYEGVIKSAARVTYGQAQDVLDGTTAPELKHVEANIKRCGDLAKLLMSKRFREGSLDLDLPETQIEVDEAGMPTDIMRSERLFAHRLIEELMLMANVAVARFFRERDIPALYRIHDEPAAEAMQNFESFLKAFGYKQKLSGISNIYNKLHFFNFSLIKPGNIEILLSPFLL
jgi:ribonuclease R